MTRFGNGDESSFIERGIPGGDENTGVRPYADYRKDFNYLAANEAELNETYRNEWVAILDERVVDHSADHAALLKRLRSSGVMYREPVIAHCPTVPSKAVF